MSISLTDIQHALMAEDVEGLLALGAPDDEYFREADAIASVLSSMSAEQITLSSIVTVISNVWSKYFGPFMPEDISKRTSAFQNIAQRLLN